MADDPSGRLSVPRSLPGRARRDGLAGPAGRRAGRWASPLLLALVAAVGFAASFMLLHHSFWGRHQIVDTPLYQAYGDATRAGDVPYLDFRVEYPPGAFAAFLAPELTAPPGQFGAYGRAFEKWMAACGIAMTCLVVIALRLLAAGRRRVALALGAVAVSPLLLGSVMLSRFDLLPAMLTVAGVVGLLAGRNRLGVAILAIAAVTKLYPLVCLPVALVWVAKTRGRREAGLCAAIALAVAAVVLVPFLAIAPAGLEHSFAVQLGRPLQVESLGAAFLVALHHVAGLRLVLHEDHGSRNIEGAAATWIGAFSTVLQVALLAAVYWLLARGPASRERLVVAVAASVAVFVAFGKVFSPQYLIWLIPLVPLVAGLPGLVASLLTAASLALTQLWFPDRYLQYAVHLDGLETGFVLARDLAVVALVVVLLRALAEPASRREARPAPVPQVGADLVVPA